jgi:hypothetical protein
MGTVATEAIPIFTGFVSSVKMEPFCSFALFHDGLAAASVHAGQSRTVVLTLGTAIGAGYPPPDQGLRPMRFFENQ